MNKRGFTLVEMMISVVIFMLAITIAITSVVTSSSIVARTDQRSLVAESARSIVSFISKESANADPLTTQVYRNYPGFSFGVYTPEIREYVCLAIGPGMIGPGYGLVGDVTGGTSGNGFTQTDNKIDDFDFMRVIDHYGNVGSKTHIDNINAANKAGTQIDSEGTEYAYLLNKNDEPVNSYINSKGVTIYYTNKDIYYFNSTKEEYNIIGDSNGDMVTDGLDFNNIIMNFGTKYDGLNTQSISFREDGTTLIVNAYQDAESNSCLPGNMMVKTLYKGPLHDPNSIKLSSFKASFENICYKQADGTGDCASTNLTGTLVKKYETLRLSVQFEEILPKQSKVAEQKKAKAQISTSIPVGVE